MESAGGEALVPSGGWRRAKCRSLDLARDDNDVIPSERSESRNLHVQQPNARYGTAGTGANGRTGVVISYSVGGSAPIKYFTK